MINVDAEVNKHKNVRDRGELGLIINEYKSLALQNSDNIFMAGQFNMVAHKLQEIWEKMPAPALKKLPGASSGAPTKTARISKEEKAKISDAWVKRAGKK